MGRCSVPRRAALLLGVLLAVGRTGFPEIALAQQSSGGAAEATCTAGKTEITLDAKLDVPVTFSCPSDSPPKPEKALKGEGVAFDDQCSGDVTFSTLMFAAGLAVSPKSKVPGSPQATEYSFTVTRLPPAEQNVCYICQVPSAPNPGLTSKADTRNGESDVSQKTDCKVKIRVPADKSGASTPAPSSSTPAPSSSSTSTSSAAAPSSSISTFIGAFSVCLCLAKAHFA
ncbi:sag-related sequence srs26i [Cystoisospora suis]|uniref:Sag-related sequence srs26i n=1 Tax=Cystoisospora suis TaxID=483139 RepID=A0A2C6KMK4_9APIC|nr:sag-related sequence srs26i [Cystoisospora suis]